MDLCEAIALIDPLFLYIVNYASAVALELRQDSTGNPTVSMKFKNGTDADFIDLPMFGNESSVPLSDFISLLSVGHTVLVTCTKFITDRLSSLLPSITPLNGVRHVLNPRSVDVLVVRYRKSDSHVQIFVTRVCICSCHLYKIIKSSAPHHDLQNSVTSKTRRCEKLKSHYDCFI